MTESRFQLSLLSKGDTIMIYALIALIAEGVFVIVLAIICAFVMLRNSRLEREKAATRSEVEVVRANIKTLQAEKAEALEKMQALYDKVLRERNDLVARATALQEAMEAKPAQPKRAVRKNSTQATEQEHTS